MWRNLSNKELEYIKEQSDSALKNFEFIRKIIICILIFDIILTGIFYILNIDFEIIITLNACAIFFIWLGLLILFSEKKLIVDFNDDLIKAYDTNIIKNKFRFYRTQKYYYTLVKIEENDKIIKKWISSNCQFGEMPIGSNITILRYKKTNEKINYFLYPNSEFDRIEDDFINRFNELKEKLDNEK